MNRDCLKLYILITAGLLQSCGNLLFDNKNTIIKATPNFSESRKLVLFIKEGGATVGDSYQISVLPINKKVKDADTGNLFIADDHDGGIPEDTSRVTFHWVSDDTAVVSFDKKLRVFKKETKIDGLTILYGSTSRTR